MYVCYSKVMVFILEAHAGGDRFSFKQATKQLQAWANADPTMRRYTFTTVAMLKSRVAQLYKQRHLAGALPSKKGDLMARLAALEQDNTPQMKNHPANAGH